MLAQNSEALTKTAPASSRMEILITLNLTIITCKHLRNETLDWYTFQYSPRKKKKKKSLNNNSGERYSSPSFLPVAFICVYCRS